MKTRRILEVRGLNKHFGGLHAVKDVDFDLFEGDRSAIIGPNGAGKTTFFNLLTGYHRADSGRVIFEGKDITNWPSHGISRLGISRAFQISNIFPKLSVFDNVRSAVQAQMGKAFDIFGRASQVGVEETERILALCGLAENRAVVAGELSQGDKKKLELALALAGKPKLLFLDEPTAGMSLEETRETMLLVDRLNEEFNLTILFTEHDMAVVFDHALRITLLNRGEIIITGTPEQVRSNESAQRIYLGEY
ncbi:MAG: ABC transporter ATP-binding protein [Deltaproteobacteria bacterium]|nr:ABC transporter ATP-binding protein [Deltaproteobacteria bacterium]MBW2071879.1 ABC transporter ATP-binding protein [Deltaproteobacteria bacterium]